MALIGWSGFLLEPTQFWSLAYQKAYGLLIACTLEGYVTYAQLILLVVTCVKKGGS